MNYNVVSFVFQGKWTAQLIPNPDYFDDTEPYKMTTIVSINLSTIWYSGKWYVILEELIYL